MKHASVESTNFHCAFILCFSSCKKHVKINFVYISSHTSVLQAIFDSKSWYSAVVETNLCVPRVVEIKGNGVKGGGRGSR